MRVAGRQLRGRGVRGEGRRAAGRRTRTPSVMARGQVGYPSKGKGLWTKSRRLEDVCGAHLS